MNKGLLALSRKPGWVPITLPGEGVTDDRVVSPDCRMADMCLGSHFMSGIAILEQSEDGLVGDSGQFVGGVMMLVGSIYVIKTHLHDIEDLVM